VRKAHHGGSIFESERSHLEPEIKEREEEGEGENGVLWGGTPDDLWNKVIPSKSSITSQKCHARDQEYMGILGTFNIQIISPILCLDQWKISKTVKVGALMALKH
jgi:hypothetical protein